MSNVVQMRDVYAWWSPEEELAHAEALASYARRLHNLGPLSKRLTVTVTDGLLSGTFAFHYREEVDRLIAMLQANRDLLPEPPRSQGASE